MSGGGGASLDQRKKQFVKVEIFDSVAATFVNGLACQ